MVAPEVVIATTHGATSDDSCQIEDLLFSVDAIC